MTRRRRFENENGNGPPVGHAHDDPTRLTQAQCNATEVLYENSQIVVSGRPWAAWAASDLGRPPRFDLRSSPAERRPEESLGSKRIRKSKRKQRFRTPTGRRTLLNVRQAESSFSIADERVSKDAVYVLKRTRVGGENPPLIPTGRVN